jgi:hypothetical protein
MGKSYRKHDIIGHGGCSEKKDKSLANRKLRHKIKRLLKQNSEIEVLPILRELSDIWCFNKDGKSWFGDLKNLNCTHYPHLPYSEDKYFKNLYMKYKRK